MARTAKKTHLSQDQAPREIASSSTSSPAARTSKIAQVVILLERPGGASLGDIAAHTGWQPHTTRAALTGLRKKGHVIVKEIREGITVYRIEKAAS